MFQDSQVRTGYLIGRHAEDRGLALSPDRHLQGVQKVSGDEPVDKFAEIVRRLARRCLAGDRRFEPGGAAPGEASGAMPPAQMGKQEALKRFSVDLTERARKGEIDPIVGRDEEIRQIVDILMRRRQNNPILTGEAGVGKTAVVEGFASGSPPATCRRSAEGRVAPRARHRPCCRPAPA
jgi:type VI secretion system protein VasG